MAKNDYPIPVFHFKVDWNGKNVGFSEVTGMTQELQMLEYREGNSPTFSTMKQPGLHKYSNITLKRGVAKSDNDFFKWMNTVKMNKIERRDLTITLLNEQHQPIMVWKCCNAFPVKVDGPALKSSGNEIAVESIELAHEGCTIQND